MDAEVPLWAPTEVQHTPPDPRTPAGDGCMAVTCALHCYRIIFPSSSNSFNFLCLRDFVYLCGGGGGVVTQMYQDVSWKVKRKRRENTWCGGWVCVILSDPAREKAANCAVRTIQVFINQTANTSHSFMLFSLKK